MPSKEDTGYQIEHDRTPASVSDPSPNQEPPFPTARDTHEETVPSQAYTGEEEALVQERLKNLGYL
jgi:hypothetical protein